MERHLDVSLSPSERAKDLLSKMSVEEKIGQLCKLDGFKSYQRKGSLIELTEEFKGIFKEVPIGTMYGLIRADWWTGRTWGTGIEPHMMAEAANTFQKYVVENTRFHIPLMIAEEAPHGLMALGCTVFPTGLGMGATWNPALIEKLGAVIGEEGAAAGIQTVYGPILDMSHDPRWSRTEEDFSEDPYLTSQLGVSYVKGLQGGTFPKPGRPFSTLKHLAAHGDPTGGHNQAAAHLGPIEFRNVQFKPFEACFKAGAQSAMCAYNAIDGVPCAANRKLLTELLREELGFDGFIVSDRGAIPLLKWWNYVGTFAEASATAIKAGLDTDEGCLDMHSKGLKDALVRGLIGLEDIDRSVGRVLTLKFRLGLFENPYLKSDRAVELCGSKGNREVALQAARESLVLVSNKEKALPLKDVRKIAVIGPNADTPMNQLGDYTAPQRKADVSTPLAGLQLVGSKLGVEVAYAKGCKVRSLRRDLLAEALETAKLSDAVVLVLGGSSAPENGTGFLENGASRCEEVKEDVEFDKESGEGYDRAKLRLAGLQLELLRKLKTLGKRLITVLIMGRPLIIDEIMELSDATLLAWYPGQEGGQAIAEAVFGLFNPGGKLPISFPRDEAQLPVYYLAQAPRKDWPDYIDMNGAPSLQFGFGLSYTKFEYLSLSVDKKTLKSGESVKIEVKVRNSGELAGDEVVQLYLTDKACTISRASRELRGFKRIHLVAGESRTVEFVLTPEELGIFNSDLKFVVEPGEFTIAAGGSLDSLIEAEFEVR